LKQNWNKIEIELRQNFEIELKQNEARTRTKQQRNKNIDKNTNRHANKNTNYKTNMNLRQITKNKKLDRIEPVSRAKALIPDDVILTRSGLLDTCYRVWMMPLPEREDKSG